MRHLRALRSLIVDDAPIPSVVHPLHVHLLTGNLALHREEALAWPSPWYAIVGGFHYRSMDPSDMSDNGTCAKAVGVFASLCGGGGVDSKERWRRNM